MIKHNCREEWLNEWAMGQTGRTVFAHMTAPNLKDSLDSLEGRDQVTIFRLRTHHAPINAHLNRIQPMIPPNCLLCNAPYETTKHFLFECPALKDLRDEHLPPNPDLGNTLYSSTQQLKKTCIFYAKAQKAADSVK